jgi:multiple sugar transport system permease protein/putative chitobiose transport system permease protein
VSTQTQERTSRRSARKAERALERDAYLPWSLRSVLLTILGAVVVLVFMLPLLWTLASALRPQTETFSTLSPISVRTLVPQEWTLSNFESVVSGSFGQAMLNSVLVTFVTLVLGLVVCSMAAFALAVLDFKGRGVIFAIMVVSFLIPFDAIAVPLSSVFRDLGLQNSYAGLILPGIGNGLAVYLLRGFFQGVPKELSEAARVDGLSWWGVFLRVYLPLSKPGLIGAGLILFVFQWQAYLWPLLVAPSTEYKVAPVALAQFAGQYGVDFGAIFAGSVLTTLVPLVVVLLFQRHFTQSLSTSGGKE